MVAADATSQTGPMNLAPMNPAEPAGARVALVNAVIITGTGQDPAEGAVVVEGDRIVDVTEGPGTPAGADVVVDCRGRSLLPGLIDAHVHIGALDVDIQQQQRRYFDSEAALLMGRALTRLLDLGYTTVRDAGGADAGFRRALEHGVVQGPRLLVSGHPLSQTGGHGDVRQRTEHGDVAACGADIGLSCHVADGPDEVRRAVREELRRGADQIKVMASGGVMSPADRLESTQYSAEEIRVAVQTAEQAGSYVLAHAYTPASVQMCARAGVRSIEHGNLIDAETAALMAEHGTFLDPTLVTYERLYEEGEKHGVPAENLDKLQLVLDAGLDSLRLAQTAGVKIASGSDLLGPLAGALGREIALQAQVLGPYGAITAATSTNAELLRLDDELGTIAVGKLADMIVVDGDPLQEPGLLGRAEHLSVVMIGGRLHKNLC
jgi:imidazolonepropionase-like amidohydrolase